jgi:hypothetical protein
MQMIDVITKLKEIAERSPEEIGRAIAAAEKMSGQHVAEEKGKKPDYLDFDKDGDKDEPMTKALKDKEEKKEVAEDVQITLSGSDAVLAEILKLAGMIGAKTLKGPEAAAPAPMAPNPTLGMPTPPPPLPALGGAEMGAEPMMDSAYDASTTPTPVVMDSSAAIPSGNDLAKTKVTAPKVSPGDNPMQGAISFR